MVNRRVEAGNYATVNEAIDRLPDSGGEVVVADPLVVTEPIRIDRNLVFRGVGRAHHSQAPGGAGAKLVLPDGAAHPMFEYRTDVRYCTWENLVLDGNYRNGASGAAIVTDDASAMYATIKSCFFDQWGDDIVALDTGYGLQVFGSTLEGMTGDAITLDGFDRCRVSHSYFAIGGRGGSFLDLTGVTNTAIQGNYLQDAGEHALYLDDCERIASNGNVFRGAGRNSDGASVVRLENSATIFMSGDIVHADADSAGAITAIDVADGKIDVLHSAGADGGIITRDLRDVHTGASVQY